MQAFEEGSAGQVVKVAGVRIEFGGQVVEVRRRDGLGTLGSLWNLSGCGGRVRRSGGDGGFDRIVDGEHLVHLSRLEDFTYAGTDAGEGELEPAVLALSEREDQAAQIDHNLGMDAFADDLPEEVVERASALFGAAFGKGQDDRVLHTSELAEIQGDPPFPVE